MKKAIIILLATSIALSPVIAKGAVANTFEVKQENIQQNIQDEEVGVPYKVEKLESNEYNFVKSLAESKGISYSGAKKLNDENTMKYMKARVPQFQTMYTTEKQYYRVNNSVSLVMAVEVKYIHDNFNGGNQIASVGEPYMGISGARLYRWSESGFNKDVNINTARISTTGQAYIEVSNDISAGIDIPGLSLSSSIGYSKIYTTNVKTYEMTIYALSL
ncbi:hypothetical protein [Clostridium senegalense]|uniref:hypothetical protein n=1 Tax=Clostridium senegalense TaxID=1465809 RepID=UPI000288DAE5|nr:hypothetical protein [Clostridium senegalense]